MPNLFHLNCNRTGKFRLKHERWKFRLKRGLKPLHHVSGNRSATTRTAGGAVVMHQLRCSQQAFGTFLHQVWSPAEFICNDCPIRALICRRLYLPPGNRAPAKPHNRVGNLVHFWHDGTWWVDNCDIFDYIRRRSGYSYRAYVGICAYDRFIGDNC